MAVNIYFALTMCVYPASLTFLSFFLQDSIIHGIFSEEHHVSDSAGSGIHS